MDSKDPTARKKARERRAPPLVRQRELCMGTFQIEVSENKKSIQPLFPTDILSEDQAREIMEENEE